MKKKDSKDKMYEGFECRLCRGFFCRYPSETEEYFIKRQLRHILTEHLEHPEVKEIMEKHYPEIYKFIRKIKLD